MELFVFMDKIVEIFFQIQKYIFKNLGDILDIALFNFLVFLVSFCTHDLSTGESRIFESPSVTVLGLICGFMLDSIFEMKFGTPVFGA